MAETIAHQVEEADSELEAPPARSGITERILDNLPLWMVVSAAIGLLYLVWATLEILSRYVGAVPKITP